MKKGNKILALTLSAALVAGCLAGCGSKGGSDSKSGSFDTSPERKAQVQEAHLWN